MAPNELALLQQYARTQDAIAFRGLVEQHQDMVFAACHRVLGNRADAEDAAQNCFLKLAQAADRLKAPIAGWLHTVAVRSAIDILRGETARRARERVVARNAADASPSRAPWADVRGEVDAAIVALPERLRTPIVLYFLEGRTQADVAAELGVKPPAVSKRLRQGVEALRCRLRRAGVMTSAVALPTMLAGNAVEAAPAALVANLGKVALAGTNGARTAAAAGGSFASLKLAAVIAVAAGVGAGALAIHQATRPQHPAPGAAAATAPVVPLTTETVLDAVLTLPPSTLSLGELHKLVNEQLGVHLSCHSQGTYRRVRLEPGKHTVRDVLKSIAAATSLTTEVLADRDRIFLCLWRKPDAQGLAKMMELARSDDVLERCTAARWLTAVGGRDALVQLLKLLSDPDARVRYFASQGILTDWPSATLATMPSPVACVAPEGTGLVVARIAATETWRWTQRNLLQIARSLRNPNMLPVLRKLLAKVDGKAPDHRNRYHTPLLCNAVAAIGGPEAEAILLAAADRLPKEHARYALHALGTFGTDAAIARLSKEIDAKMKKGKHEGLHFLVSALSSSDSPVAARKIIQLLKHPGLRQNEARGIMHYLVRSNAPEAQAVCLERFKATEDPGRRVTLAHALQRIPGVREILFAELTQGGAVGRLAALALAPTHDPRLVPVLVEVLGTDVEALQADGAGRIAMSIAISELGRMGSPEAVKALAPLSRSADLRLRRQALAALGKSHSPEAREVLKAGLKDPDAFVHTQVATALTWRSDPAYLEPLLAATRIGSSKGKTGPLVIWQALAAVGDERAIRELLAAVAKGDSRAASAIVLSTHPDCVKAVRDVLVGDDDKLRGELMDGYRSQSRIVPLSTYYAVGPALAELPGANEELKSERVNMLGWAYDPRGNDALGKLLLDDRQSPRVHRQVLFALLQKGQDPSLVTPLRHVLEHTTDKRLRQEAETILRTWNVVPARQPGDPGPAGPGPAAPGPKDPPDEREFPPPPDA